MKRNKMRWRVSLVLIVITSALRAIFAADSSVDGLPSPKEFRDFASTHDGDPERGKTIFNFHQMGACFKCHSVDGSASKAGPDLFAAGDKFPRRELINAILEPSAAIAIGYGTT